ncbi:MAG: hypothetical protein ABFS19_09360 [Thermodesulfobacteriota bacterium]
MKKNRASLVIALLCISLLPGCGLLSNRVETLLESVGTELTGEPVTVDDVNLRIGRGLGTIEGVRLANPEGYVADYAMDWKLLELNLGIIATVAEAPLVLDRLIISKPLVNFEKRPGGSNIRDIVEHAVNNQSSADEKAEEEESGEPIRIVIEELLIEGVTISIRRKNGDTHSFILPTIKRQNVGGTIGKTPAELGVYVLSAISGEVIKQAAVRELMGQGEYLRQSLTGEKMLAMISERLDLTVDQQEKIRPLIETFRTGLFSTIETWISQGFIDLDLLAKQLTPLTNDLKQQLELHLDKVQRGDLDGLMSDFHENGIEIIRAEVVKQISTKLGITAEQLQQLKLILTSDELKQIRPIVENFSTTLLITIRSWVDQGYVDLDELEEQLAPLIEDLRAQLKSVLGKEQLHDVDTLIESMKKLVVDLVRSTVVRQVSVLLEISPEQIRQIRSSLSTDQLEEIRPIVAGFVSELMVTARGGVKQGYIDPEELEDQLHSLITDLRKQLQGVLTEDQYRDLANLVDSLKEKIVEFIQSTVVEQVSTRLEISPEQIRQIRSTLSADQLEEIRPIMAEFIRGLFVTVRSWVKQGYIDGAELETQLDQPITDLRRQLKNVLAEEQYLDLEELVDTLKEKVADHIRTLLVTQISERLGISAQQLQEIRLTLSRDQLTEIRPIVRNFSRELLETIQTQVKQGFVEPGELVAQLDRSMTNLRTQLQTVLDEAQYREVENLIETVREKGVELARSAVATQLTKRLAITAEQLRQVRPDIENLLVELSGRLEEFSSNPERSFEDFQVVYETVTERFRSRLAEKLQPEQMAQLETLFTEVLDRIRTSIF